MRHCSIDDSENEDRSFWWLFNFWSISDHPYLTSHHKVSVWSLQSNLWISQSLCYGEMKLNWPPWPQSPKVCLEKRMDLNFWSKNTLSTVKNQGGSILLWSCVAQKTKIAKLRQTLNEKVLQSVKKVKVRRGWLLQQDYDPKQTLKNWVSRFLNGSHSHLTSRSLTICD